MYDGTLKFDTSMDTSGFQKDANSLGSIVKGLSVFSLLQKGFNAVVSSLDSAISRYDTLNQYPKVMQNLGYTAEAASASLDRLSDGISGLPTALDDAATYTKQWALATGDLDLATDLYLAINDGAIAYGASAQQAASIQEQLNQMISTGTYDLQSWKIIQQSCPGLMDTVAKAMLGESASAESLRTALNDGTVSTGEFESALITLDQNGSSSVTAFSTAAKTASGGIATSWSNLKTAIVRNTTNIITAIDSGLGETRFQSIEHVIEQMKNGVNKALSLVAAAFGAVSGKADVLVPVVIGLVAAMKAYQIATSAATVVTTAAGVATEGTITLSTLHAAVLALVTKAKAADAAATANVTAALSMMAAGEVTAAEAGSLLTVKEALLAATKGVLTGQIGLATAAQLIWNAALEANPIGLVVAAVAALVAGIVLLVKWLSSGTSEYKEQREAVEALADAQEELAASAEENAAAFEKTSSSMEAEARVASDLVDSIDEVSASSLDAATKSQRMTDLVDQLNGAVEGLNIAYDEETGAIRNVNSGQELSLEQIRDLVNAKSELARTDAWTERRSELLAEQAQIQEELILLDQQRQEILSNANLTTMQQATLLADLTATEEGYTAQMEDSEARLAIVNEQLAASTAEAAQQIVSDYELMESAVTENGENIQQVAEQWGVSTDDIIAAMREQDITLDEWVSAQEDAWSELEDAVREKTDSVVNSFERIPDEFEMSAQKMLENLQSNKELYARWEANMEEITRQLGPTAAEEFSKLGPEANSAVEEILGSTELLQEYRDVFGVTIDKATGQAVESWNDPNFIGAPAAAVESSAAQVSASTALSDAAQDQVEGTKQAFEDTVNAVDFTAVGQTISENIADGFSSLDLSSVAASITDQLQEINTSAKTLTNQMTQSIATAISSGSSNIKSQTTRMSTAIVQAMESMVTGGKNQAERMVTNIAVAIAARQSNSINQTKVMANDIVNAMEPMVTGGKNQAERMLTMAAIAIATKASNVTGQAKSLSAGVVSELNGMVSGGYNAGVQLMDGVVSGMAARQSSVYAKANQIANNVAATMRKSLQIHSPSRVTKDIFEKVMLGAEGGMESMENKVYRTADNISSEIAKHLTISPELAGRTTSSLLGLSNTAMSAVAVAPMPATVRSSTDGDSTSLLQKAVELLGKYLPELAELQISMDGREVGRAVAPYIDEQLGF